MIADLEAFRDRLGRTLSRSLDEVLRLERWRDSGPDFWTPALERRLEAARLRGDRAALKLADVRSRIDAATSLDPRAHW